MRTVALLLAMASLAACDEIMLDTDGERPRDGRAIACPVDMTGYDPADFPGCR